MIEEVERLRECDLGTKPKVSPQMNFVVMTKIGMD